MKFLILLSALIFLGACSEKDEGVRYSDNYIEQQKQEKAGQTASGCAFKDVDFKPNKESYSASTEGIITELFSKYVTELQPLDSLQLSGQVKYKSWFNNKDDKKKLCEVLNHFNNTDGKALAGNDKKAFYINAYNIFTIELILKSYSVLEKSDDRDREQFPDARSIKNINSLGDKVWDVYKWKVGSESLSLNQIEKGILVSMDDARIHFAVNCASKGCPPLRNEAFTASQLDVQLDEMSNYFISSLGYHDFELFDEYDSSVENFYEVSSIFKWYAADFENDSSGRYGSVRGFIVYHLTLSEEVLGFPKEDLLKTSIWTEEYSKYNWALNEVSE